MKSDEERQRFMRSMRSDVVREVRDESVVSSFRSFSISVMHFLRGMEGKSASASKETRISPGWSLTS